MYHDELGMKIKRLPAHLLNQVTDYIDFLIDKYGEENDDTDPFQLPI